MLSRFAAELKASFPRTVSESGNVTVVSVGAFSKADAPISVVPAGTEYVAPVFAFG